VEAWAEAITQAVVASQQVVQASQAEAAQVVARALDQARIAPLVA
jgi:hypothetical protein